MDKTPMEMFVEVLCWMIYAAGVATFGEDLPFFVKGYARGVKPWCML